MVLLRLDGWGGPPARQTTGPQGWPGPHNLGWGGGAGPAGGRCIPHPGRMAPHAQVTPAAKGPKLVLDCPGPASLCQSPLLLRNPATAAACASPAAGLVPALHLALGGFAPTCGPISPVSQAGSWPTSEASCWRPWRMQARDVGTSTRVVTLAPRRAPEPPCPASHSLVQMRPSPSPGRAPPAARTRRAPAAQRCRRRRRSLLASTSAQLPATSRCRLLLARCGAPLYPSAR